MGPQRGYPAALQDQNLVGLHQAGDPMGDQDDGAALLVLLQPGAEVGVSLGVHSGQGVVKNHDGACCISIRAMATRCFCPAERVHTPHPPPLCRSPGASPPWRSTQATWAA
jgi:hypothetical protein